MEDLTFDSAALSKLTSRIDSGLSGKKHKNTVKTTPRLRPEKKSLETTSARKRTSDGNIKSQTTKKEASSVKVPPKLKQTGSFKIAERPLPKPLDKSVKQKSAKPAQKADSSLKDEILALGGDQDDLKLIEGVDSDSELDQAKATPADKALAKELAKFMKGLPFEESKVQADAETSEEEDDEDSGEDEDEDSDDDTPVKPVTKMVTEAIKDPISIKTHFSGKLLVEPQSEWCEIKLPDLPLSGGSRPSDRTTRELHNYGKDLLKQENVEFASINATSSSHKFYQEMMTSGTLTDKISALTLSVQESPLHNQQTLESLLALAKKRSRSQAVQVLGALKDLFGAGVLLPNDRRLRYFASQPALAHLSSKVYDNWNRSQPLPQPLLKEHLLIWTFEDWLKSTYFEIIKVLETWSNDEITYARLKSIDYVYDLLKEKPEQEANLLHLLVKKLGDPEKQVASRVSSHLVHLQVPHPFMKPVIISNLEADILFKPGEKWLAKYYAIITLNQTILNIGQQEVVKKLLDIYFAMFLSLLGDKDIKPETKSETNSIPLGSKRETKQDSKAKSGSKKTSKPTINDAELKEKITSGILTGINRAFPYAATNDDFFEKKLDTLFKITHSSNFNTSIQALILLQQLCSTQPSASDRFYRTLYESLLDPRLLTTSKHALYINLLYRSLKADTNVKRVQAFVKRLGQIIAMHQPPFVCAIIYMLKDLEESFPSLHSLLDQPEAYDSDDEDSIPATLRKTYDGKKRDPQFSNADNCCLWEIHPLNTHFHPSVALFTQKLLSKQKIESKPDLSVHTLINFLDRFVYRNPKKITDALKGVSLMQPMATANTSDMLVSGRAVARRRGPAINTSDFTHMKDDKVAADEVFFHKYFTTKEAREAVGQKKRDKKRKTLAEDEDSGEENNEDDIWKALVDSNADLGGADEVDDFEDDADGFSEVDDYSDDSDDVPEASQDETEDQEEDEIIVQDGDMDLEDGDEDAFFASDEEADLPEDEDQALVHKSRKKRKLLRDLPTFASAEDYAKMLEGEDDGME